MILYGGLSEKEEAKAMELTEQDNIILDQFRGKMDTTDAQIKRAVETEKIMQMQ